jgi:hypothetical protein
VAEDDIEGEVGVLGSVFEVSLGLRETLIDLFESGASVRAWAAWRGARAAPPVLQNREGDPFSLLTSYFAPTSGHDWTSIEAALDEQYEREQGNEHVWVEHLDLDSERIVRASLRRTGDEIVVSTNSVARFERVRERLVSLGLQHLRSESPSESERGDPGTSSGEIELPEEALDEIRDHMEDRWLAEHVPAFGGLTPRQALDDPTRRHDVIKLIESLDRDPVVGFAPYDVDRLRRKLGLLPGSTAD